MSCIASSIHVRHGRPTTGQSGAVLQIIALGLSLLKEHTFGNVSRTRHKKETRRDSVVLSDIYVKPHGR